MKLPNGELAVVDIRKLQDYRLSPTHRDGRHKARGFAAAGIRQSDAEELRTALLATPVNAEALPGTELFMAGTRGFRSEGRAALSAALRTGP
jgi:hypothetical protein